MTFQGRNVISDGGGLPRGLYCQPHSEFLSSGLCTLNFRLGLDNKAIKKDWRNIWSEAIVTMSLKIQFFKVFLNIF